ncbi:MAG TPA: P27 family phage terminase small subunit, partial [Dongiaceae bacterium]|nr:P27 family phage terminase small subunit [Dongiaceae bacterium]
VKRLNFVRYTDRPVLERYCEALADYWHLQTELRGKSRVYWTDTKHGKMKRIEPTVLLMHRQEALLLQYEDRLGLNPLARQRILVGMAATQGALPLSQGDDQDKDHGTDSGLGGEAGPAGPGSPVGLLN